MSSTKEATKGEFLELFWDRESHAPLYFRKRLTDVLHPKVICLQVAVSPRGKTFPTVETGALVGNPRLFVSVVAGPAGVRMETC